MTTCSVKTVANSSKSNILGNLHHIALHQFLKLIFYFTLLWVTKARLL